MNVREKLVELLNEIIDGGFKWHSYNYESGEQLNNDEIASHLIANGVTVQECGHWVSLTECANAGVYCSVCKKKVDKEDYASCNRKNKFRSSYCPHCGAKMIPSH